MPIPTYDKLLDPLLKMAEEQPITRQSATEAMTQHFALSPEEASVRIPSGASTVVRSRTGWAMTFLTKGGLIEKIAPKTYRATSKGIELRSHRPNGVMLRDLEALEGWEEAWHPVKREGGDASPGDADHPEVSTETTTPAEALDAALKTINADVKSRLLDAILAQSPTFFERLVLDVLVAMGYGGSRADAAEHLGKSGDEGVDGRINQDPLGLDQIVVQAKRYSRDRPIDRNARLAVPAENPLLLIPLS
jgi:restriction system protein